MKKTFIFIFLCIVGIGGFLFVSQNRPVQLELEKQKISFSDQENKYAIEVNYPVIKQGLKSKIQKTINEQIFAWASQTASAREQEYKGYLEELKDLPEYGNLSYVSEYSIKESFERGPFLNIVFENYAYTGGAHGGTSLYVFVFNTKTGERVSFFDVFQDQPFLTLSRVSLEALKKIDPKLEIYTFAEEGLAPSSENFEHWTIEKEGVRFLFGDYQVGPYTSGRPEVVLLWEEIDSILSPEFKKLLLDQN